MSAIASHVSNADDLVLNWRQSRTTMETHWRDGQWEKFDRVCNEEIQTLAKRNAFETQALDVELSRALAILDSD